VESKTIKDEFNESKVMNGFQILLDEINVDPNTKGRNDQTLLHYLVNTENEHKILSVLVENGTMIMIKTTAVIERRYICLIL